MPKIFSPEDPWSFRNKNRESAGMSCNTKRWYTSAMQKQTSFARLLGTPSSPNRVLREKLQTEMNQFSEIYFKNLDAWNHTTVDRHVTSINGSMYSVISVCSAAFSRMHSYVQWCCQECTQVTFGASRKKFCPTQLGPTSQPCDILPVLAVFDSLRYRVDLQPHSIPAPPSPSCSTRHSLWSVLL